MIFQRGRQVGDVLSFRQRYDGLPYYAYLYCIVYIENRYSYIVEFVVIRRKIGFWVNFGHSKKSSGSFCIMKGGFFNVALRPFKSV
jgi:hypothetical protein